MQTPATARHARSEDVRLDPITSSVVEHGLGSVTDEMANVVVATAYSPLVRDLFDFTVALCNPRGEMVVQGVGMAIHLGVLPAAVDTILQRFGNDMRPGDCVIMNDAYEGGMHLPNVILLTPNFADGELLGYAVTMAHHTDIGGHVPGSVPVNSRDIFAEGLRIPPMFFERDGVRNETLLALIERNVRVPRDFFGDLDSQVSACRVAEKRLQTLAHRGGLGVRRRVRILAPEGGILQIRSGRAKQAPWGTAGGRPGTTCQNVLDPGTPNARRLRGVETMHVPGDTVYLHVTPGAGGHGAPEARDPALVARDVRDGKISVARARDVYRVAVSADGVIDEAGTARLRATARK